VKKEGRCESLRIVLILMTLFLVLFTVSGAARAAEIANLNAEIDDRSKLVTVRGNIDSGADQKVGIIVLDPEEDLDYIDQTSSTSDGSFEFSYKLKNESTGTYTVKVGGEGVETLGQTTFDYQPRIDECFIATACYGSKYHSAVALLRQFRDQCLLTNAWGTAFVDSYYRYSPSVAEYIAGNGALKTLVRILLTPLVVMAYLVLHLKYFLLLLLLVPGVKLFRYWRRGLSY
jgi:hypothetical protein